MKLEIAYPALAFGATTKMNSCRLVLCAPTIEVDIAVAAESEAPVAFSTVSRHGKPGIEVREHDGSFYIPLAPFAKVFSDEALANPLDGSGAIFGRLVHTLIERVGHRRAPNETKPERLFQNLSGSRSNLTLLADAKAVVSKLVDADTTIADLAEWEAMARARIESLVVIDGMVWEKTPEPCYEVVLANGEIAPTRSDVFMMTRELSPNDRHGGWDDLSYRYFAADDLDGALECARRLCTEGTEIDVRYEIEVTRPAYIHLDYAEHEFDRLSRVCVTLFEEHLRGLGKADMDMMWSVPAALLGAWAHLRDEVATRAVGDPGTDRLDDLVSGFCAELETNAEWAADLITYKLDPRDIRDMVDAWENRRMGIDLQLPTTTP